MTFQRKTYLANILHSHLPWVRVHLYPHAALEDQGVQEYLVIPEVLTHQEALE
jgi:hypothetical protein